MKFAYGMQIHQSVKDLTISTVLLLPLLFMLKGKSLLLLQVTSYMYGTTIGRGETASPAVVLKTRRSLRAVHFHPHGAPFLLTAEVNDLDSSDSSVTRATIPGCLRYPPPAVYVANVGNRPVGLSSVQVESSALMQFHIDANAVEQRDHMMSSMEMSSAMPSNSYAAIEDTSTNYCPVGLQTSVCDTTMDAMKTTEVQLEEGYQQSSSSKLDVSGGANRALPFISQSGGVPRPSRQSEAPVAPLEVPSSITRTVVSERSGLWDHSSRTRLISASEFGQAAAELPCTVKLRIWTHDIKNPCSSLNAGSCRLSIPHAVLCSEMGTHFSPCGRFLAACVACVLPQMEADPELLTQLHQDFTGTATSPTRHPISAREVMYELRIYSLEETTFGSVLASRAIRAAHCLTSIQFSPTSEHILLAYGRRHSSLLKSIVINGETSLPIYTVLEVYRVSDMELVSVLPSAEDEVNVACFHPLAGGGLVYGTKEGKLRFLQYDGAHGLNCTGPNFFSEEDMVEVQTYALEG
ncbi:hypothetical protein F0562_002369 [Nyssa sinensis]|uniref:Uncharacterized protein n=1 Tax=Nyssa sinensis TaxID=561372 RepID=A0A5J5C5K4_9ASTE|nr:hypothetical protein F0562_002369 [Nyssa sinensis]